jgi:hypothetical protein
MTVQRGSTTSAFRGKAVVLQSAGSSSHVVPNVDVSRYGPSDERDHPQAAEGKHDGGATVKNENYDGKDDVDPEDQPGDPTPCSGALR